LLFLEEHGKLKEKMKGLTPIISKDLEVSYLVKGRGVTQMRAVRAKLLAPSSEGCSWCPAE
jgi:hypothetical protein